MESNTSLCLGIKLRIGTLDNVSSLLSNHVHIVLDTAIWNDWEDRGINDTKALDSVNLELWINHTLLNVLGQTASSARICAS
jgi:hypothetical protein